MYHHRSESDLSIQWENSKLLGFIHREREISMCVCVYTYLWSIFGSLIFWGPVLEEES